jgi:enoyl-CoA hydratase/carnithine racemase
MTEQPLARLEIDAGLALVTLDQPPVNALDQHLVAELAIIVAGLRADSDVRAVIVTGGAKVFAAGGDVKEMAEWDYPRAVQQSSALGEVCTALARLPVPVIAAINGYALGGGLELALAADLRVCAEDARLGFPEILLGLIPGAGGTQRLPRLVGDSRAKDLIFTGRTLRGPEALAIGLVDRVVGTDGVVAAAQAIAAPFRTGPALAVRAAKEAVDRGRQVDLASGLDVERALFNGLFATEDRAIGMRSFLEHGPGKAVFGGR